MEDMQCCYEFAGMAFYRDPCGEYSTFGAKFSFAGLPYGNCRTSTCALPTAVSDCDCAPACLETPAEICDLDQAEEYKLCDMYNEPFSTCADYVAALNDADNPPMVCEDSDYYGGYGGYGGYYGYR